ncbi:hypothetical protein D0869_13656 [Hortaea werneckii]|uniref:Anaphase-promoting complex subunit 1 N-terminal domain-containing protein n=1 Tax=Hortaea werneckii TaxID=91943 RepID=A0A3M6W4V6_HORWE|nr:hypothetical protein D0869_13656 [Hortaea werneckii]
MAVESMGVHTPVALSYLIREGILPQDPKPSLYQWETYADTRNGDEEELLVTKNCVAWSQANFVRNVYRFELEGEDVEQALLANFPNNGEAKRGSNGLQASSDGMAKVLQDRKRPFATESIERSRDDEDNATRALVVFLRTKAHVYFLHGASHVLDLPFEIERAIPAAQGCLIQRKPTTAAASTSTPRVPSAPPNSFLSTQLTANSSYLQSPSLARSFGGSQPTKPSPLGGSNGKLDALFNDAFGTPGKSEQRGFARLYTLTNPLSDFGVVTYSLQHQRPRLPGKSKAGLTVEFETLDPAEEIIYASRKREVDSTGSLMLMVTVNQDLVALTVWQAWYIEEKSLKDLLKQRADQRAAKATRRSSFLNTNLGTGATTPAIRAREDNRESLVGGTLRPPGEPTAPKSRKKTRQEEEAAMASQMDPDYQPNTSQQAARESRRISSLNQDFRASQNASNASFGGHSNRRNTSFGGHNERRSYGHRKSRGSTPGSIFSRSIGPDDDFMDLDRSGGFDDEENVESVVRHIRATLEAAGADNVFGGADEEFKRELVVRKLHSFPLGEGGSHSSAAPQFRVAVLRDPQTPRTSSDVKVNVYVHSKHTSVLNCLSLLVKQRTLWPELSSSPQVQIPIVISENNMGKCSDIVEVVDGDLKAILIDGAGLILSPDAQEICPLPPSASYRVYSPLDLPLRHGSKDKDVGKSRTIQQPDSSMLYAHAGKHGLYDEIDAEAVHHRRRLRLRPESSQIDALMRACEHVLPSAEAQRVRPTWYASFAWLMERADTCAGSASSPEFIAFVAAALRPLVPLLDEKARATLNLSKVAAGKKQAQDTNAAKMGKKRHASQICSRRRRLVDAVHVLRYQQPTPQIGECPKQPDWTDAHHFEQQRRVMHFVALRMLSLPSGDGMVHYQCETPLLTEKYPISGFSSVCLMQPMAHVLTIDRSGMSEEKFGWAYFHAGVSAGLRISHSAKGIDTSWIAFNKPSDLTNRHAGLLLALGLGGHLRSLAKWLSFKYLTPKHTMTSVGLLLGLSASYLGTMDGLITRMLSVHITRMLPAGAAELNVSHITQTAGLMGIGLLYYNTQHRRMSEIMLSEIEFMEVEDPDSGPDPLKDESYRLAAGFALGFINLGKGKHLRGLHGLFLPERLLAVAVGPRPVHAVHVFDRATAGAVMAIAMIYMKSGDQAVAHKIDIPDTEAQYDHVRPDMLMLRAMARHIIMWHSIKTESVGPDVKDTSQIGWIQKNLPKCYTCRISQIHDAHGKYPFSTSDVPFYNIATGLAWALGLKYAGSGNEQARDEIVELLDTFYMISGQSHFYDAKLARSTVRRCIDVLALSAAMVMAGTGDLVTFRRLRRLHGRTDSETPYGSHLATHMAVGVLFMGGGTYTLSASDFAIASLMCAFYPLFPMDVHDNRVHLQAFRHFWVFAAEARCLVAEDVDTHRPVPMSILLTAKDGSTRPFKAPCLLPDLDTIRTIETNDPAYWKVTLDFVNNPNHLDGFRRSQVIHVRHCHASEAHNSAFSATMAALNDARVSDQITSAVAAIFELPGLGRPKKSDIELVLPPDVHGSMLVDGRGTVIDDRLTLQKAAGAMDKDTLWNLRLLFAWAEKVKDEGDGTFRWLGDELVPALRARIDARAREIGGGNA